jgi:regulator of protease activity HflC (stomatin/prohibitin superfamily)
MTLSAIIVAIALYGLAGLRIANQYQRAVVLRLGRFESIRGPGLYWIIPVIEW